MSDREPPRPDAHGFYIMWTEGNPEFVGSVALTLDAVGNFEPRCTVCGWDAAGEAADGMLGLENHEYVRLIAQRHSDRHSPA